MHIGAHQLALPLPAPDACQRWRHGRHSWRRTSDGGFDPSEFRVVAIAGQSMAAARNFVNSHHYSNTWPSVSLCYGLLDVTCVLPRLVGVLTLGVPMRQAVLTGPFPELVPYRQSLELNRLVLLDEVKAPAESWFAARCFRQAHAQGIRGILAHSDPQPLRISVIDGTKSGRWPAMSMNAVSIGWRRTSVTDGTLREFRDYWHLFDRRCPRCSIGVYGGPAA